MVERRICTLNGTFLGKSLKYGCTRQRLSCDKLELILGSTKYALSTVCYLFLWRYSLVHPYSKD